MGAEKESVARGWGAAISRRLKAVGEDASAGAQKAINVNFPTLGPIIGTQGGRVGTRDFVEGLMGVPAVSRAVAGTAAKAATGTAAKAAAKPAVTPAKELDMYERQARFVGGLFSGGLSMREAQAASGMMPRRAVLDPKDHATAVATELTQAQYAQRIASAERLKESDPDAAVAERDSATKELLDRMLLLSGANPANMALAQLPGMEEPQ
jgi:hypothetical protein